MLRQDLLEEVAQSLEKETALQIQFPAYSSIKDKKSQEKVYPIKMQDGKQVFSFLFTVKNNISAQQFHQLLALKQKNNTEHFLVFLPYISPTMRKKLIEHQMGFIDSLGNAYIHRQGLYINIKGKTPSKKSKTSKTKSIFTQTQSKVVFVLLCQPKLLQSTYREIAAKTSVSLGAVNATIAKLKKQGYVKMNSKRALINGKSLLEKWSQDFNTHWRKTYFRKQFQFRSREFLNKWKDIHFSNFNIFWGGEPAVAILTNDYLKPQQFTLYSSQKFSDLVQQLPIAQHPKGEIAVYAIFWNKEFNIEAQKTIPPILVYTDLMNSNDSRNWETANLLYDTHLSYLNE